MTIDDIDVLGGWRGLLFGQSRSLLFSEGTFGLLKLLFT
jgi:hypothetical protein